MGDANENAQILRIQPILQIENFRVHIFVCVCVCVSLALSGEMQ